VFAAVTKDADATAGEGVASVTSAAGCLGSSRLLLRQLLPGCLKHGCITSWQQLPLLLRTAVELAAVTRARSRTSQLLLML
jgi:hypothetical protein